MCIAKNIKYNTTIYLLQIYYKLMKETNNRNLFYYYKRKYDEKRFILRNEYNIYNVYEILF